MSKSVYICIYKHNLTLNIQWGLISHKRQTTNQTNYNNNNNNDNNNNDNNNNYHNNQKNYSGIGALKNKTTNGDH